jgi:hypothetical protein
VKLQKLALVIELLLAIETLDIATEAPAQCWFAETKLVASLIASALVAEEPFALAAMDLSPVGQVTHQASGYSQGSHYQEDG